MEFTECIQPACDGQFNSFWLFSTAVPRFWVLQFMFFQNFLCGESRNDNQISLESSILSHLTRYFIRGR